MPLGFSRSILTTTATATPAVATGTDNGGFWASEFKSNDSQKAKHVVIDAGSGNDWHDSHNGKFQIMWWSKGTTSDFNSDAKQVVLRTNSNFNGDSGIFVEFASDHVQAGTQTGDGGNNFHFFKWSPTGFATDYLDDEWHHFLFEVDGTSSKLFVDGVDKSSEAVDNNIGGAAQGDIGGTTRYAFIGGSTTARNDGSYNGFRTGTFQFCDVWFKNKTTGNLASNISSIYSNGWVDLKSDGKLDGTLPAPDIFVYAASDGNSVDFTGQSGASLTTVEGSGGNANQLISNTNGPAVASLDFKVVSGGSAPTLDTSIKKIGAGSFNFNGSNQGLEIDYSMLQLAGTDPWTCEFWAYPTSTNNYQHIAGHWTGATGDRSWSFGIRQGNRMFFNHTNGSGSGLSQEGSSGSISLNSWQYMSATYTGSVVYIHINGTRTHTITISGGFNEPASGINFTLGVMDNLGDDYVGKIDAMRISKTARYGTGNYTAPTSAFTTDSNTLNLTHFDSDFSNSASHSGSYGV